MAQRFRRLARECGRIAFLAGILAGCTANSSVAPAENARSGAAPAASIRSSQLLSEGFGKASSRHGRSSGWIAPDVKGLRSLIYWGDYNTSTITIYLARKSNPAERGEITSGLSSPERLFVDKALNVYASNLGNNTITAYKRRTTTPSLTISDGVNTPAGLTVDAAGTVYSGNLGNDTVTVYPKGKTSPSLTIPVPGPPEYLAVDRADNLYVSYLGGSRGTGVMEFPPGSTTGTDLGLDMDGGGALAVDRSGNVIILAGYGSIIEIFPAGQTEPSKLISLSGNTAFGLSLNKKETKLYATVDVYGAFVVKEVAYPKGTVSTSQLPINAGNWPIAVSADAVL
ncbi:MAG TPA: hypothetical protein VFE16_05365 [Candidatus Cybelea sp.]|nr:hypothetical protein [Candidatus Cybelea sp.]